MIIMRIWAIMSHASALGMDASQSLAKRRQRPSRGSVRSTTHRRGKSSKPMAASERLMISIRQSP
jgi:hypothetical protein